MAEITIKFLKSEFCRFESAFKDLKVRIKITDVWDIGEDNIFTAKIINKHGMEYPITFWTETIVEATEKLVKEYDLNLVGFTEQDIFDNMDQTVSGADDTLHCIPLNIGINTLSVNINDTTTTAEFNLVPVTVSSIKNQYLLGVDLHARSQLTIQQELRVITGVEITEISNDTTVGAKDLIWDTDNQTLQWDNGEPVTISDDYIDYILYDYTMIPGLNYGSYIRVSVPDPDDLPQSGKITETVLVDVKQYNQSDFEYWINNGYQVVLQTIAMVDIEQTLYTAEKELVQTKNYKYLDPTEFVVKRLTRTRNYSLEFPMNMLQKIIELWGHYAGESRVTIDKNRVEHRSDGSVVIRGFPFGAGISNYSTIGTVGMIDQTINAETYPGYRNPSINYWQATGTFGIIDKGIRDLFIQVAGKISAIDLLLAAGLSSGAGINSQSFSVDGVSSSYMTTESAEHSKFSGIIVDLQAQLGTGRATQDQAKRGLVNALRKKIEAGSMIYKF